MMVKAFKSIVILIGRKKASLTFVAHARRNSLEKIGRQMGLKFLFASQWKKKLFLLTL